MRSETHSGQERGTRNLGLVRSFSIFTRCEKMCTGLQWDLSEDALGGGGGGEAKLWEQTNGTAPAASAASTYSAYFTRGASGA